MKRVIHVGEGKHVEIEEGTIFRTPPVILDYTPPVDLETLGRQARKMAEVPGQREWYQLRHKQIKSLNPNMGRIPGQGIGVTRLAAKRRMNKARKEAKKDMAAIKEAGINLDQAGEEALETTLTIMRMKGDLRLKLTAARQVLEWAKAKPASKSEVTVNKAEEWLASLAKEQDDEEDKSGGDT